MSTTIAEPADRASRMIEEIESTIADGFTLPAWWYTDAAIARVERDRVFRRTWQLAAVVSDLRAPGDYLGTTISRIPVVLVRQQDGALRAFINVCRHRGHEVVQGSGSAKSLQCRYHGWTYGLDGSLRAVPRCDEEASSDKDAFPLVEIPSGVWGPFAFVNLDKAARPFEVTFAELLVAAEAHDMGLANTHVCYETVWDFDCNWKIFVDNSADCYHCPIVHTSFAKTHGVDNKTYRVTFTTEYDHHLSPSRSEGVKDWEMYAVWPNWQISASPGGMRRVRSLVPMGPSQTKVITYFAAPSEFLNSDLDRIIESETAYNLQIVGQEDREVCESVQRGLEAGVVVNGPLLLESEYAVVVFQRRLHAALTGTPRGAAVAGQ